MKQVQYPQVQAPVEDPSLFKPPPFSECTGVMVRPRKWAQQPPSYSGIVMDPSLFKVPAWQGNLTMQMQVFPRCWAQQPDSYAGPVMMIPAVVVTRRRWAWVS